MARRRHISKIRGRPELLRRAGQREPRSITLIVCEGSTEEVYFEAARVAFNLTTAEVVVADNTKGAAPISVVECAEERAEETGGYDTIFCVFDRDDHESFHRARARIKGLASRSKHGLNIQEVISVPCFELWVLLHFEKTDRAFRNCDDVVAHIRARHLGSYKKANQDLAMQLLEHITTAVDNARWLASRTGIKSENPSTSVHKVIKHLQDIAIRPRER